MHKKMLCTELWLRPKWSAYNEVSDIATLIIGGYPVFAMSAEDIISMINYVQTNI